MERLYYTDTDTGMVEFEEIHDNVFMSGLRSSLSDEVPSKFKPITEDEAYTVWSADEEKYYRAKGMPDEVIKMLLSKYDSKSNNGVGQTKKS